MPFPWEDAISSALLEVDVTIHLLVTAADVANRHLTRVVTSTRALFGAEQRFLRLVRRDFLERGTTRSPATHISSRRWTGAQTITLTTSRISQTACLRDILEKIVLKALPI